ncbi:MAG: cytochrome c [Chromatiales bacterium]|jgi:cytochrome c556
MKRMKNQLTLSLCAGILAGAAQVTGVQAQEIAFDKIEPAIKYRQNVMKAIGGLAGTSVGQLRDDLQFGPDLPAVARALQALTRDIPALFPEGTDFGETDAKPEVWSKRDAFEEAAQKATDAVDAFAASVDEGDRREMLKAFKAMGDACKNCHEDFRKEKN